MADFNQFRGCDILIYRHQRNKTGERMPDAYVLNDKGRFSALFGTQEVDGRIIADEVEDLRTLNRGSLYLIYEGLAEYASRPTPTINEPANKEDYMEIHVRDADGKSWFINPETGAPRPVMVTYNKTLFLKGHDLSHLLNDIGEWKTEQPLGKSFLEEFFDVCIPEGYEGMALIELADAIEGRKKDKKIYSGGQKLIDWLIKGEGLPPMGKELKEYLEDVANIYRGDMKDIAKSLTREEAILRGCEFLWKRGEQDAALPILKKLADEKYPKACERYANYQYEEGYLVDAMKYATIGAGLGNGRCCRLAARIAHEDESWSQVRLYLEMGMDAGDGDSFAAMAGLFLRFRDVSKGHPFYNEHPVNEALWLSIEGTRRHSSQATLIQGKILCFYVEPEFEEAGLQLLLRAEALGEAEALFWLARFYRRDHAYGQGKDLDLASVYIKRAILEKVATPNICQHLYAQILIEQGQTEEAKGFLVELSKNGYEPAQATLGKLLSGIDDAPENYYRAILWREYPDIISAKQAAALLWKLVKQAGNLAYPELAKIYREGPESIRNEAKAAECEKKALQGGLGEKEPPRYNEEK